MKTHLALLKFFLLCGSVCGVAKLQEQYKWSSLDYVYPSTEMRMEAIRTNKFVPANNLPVGIEIWNDKLFVTVPRWRPGIPSTLNYIPLREDTPESPPLIPFPDWESNEVGNCEKGLTTVYRIKADNCNRLWVLDTGTFGIGNTTTNPCPYALNVFDLTTSSRLRRYELRPEDVLPSSFIANIAVDEGTSCDDAFAYMSDELGYGLIVYSWEHDNSWRFNHPFFHPDPIAGDFNIGGLNFQWSEEGIFGLSLSPTQPDGFKTLFFSPLASNREFAVSTKILKDHSKVGSSYHDFQALADRGPKSHITAQVVDENGIQFFNLIDLNAVGCWNTRIPHDPSNIGVVERDDSKLIFPSDVKVDDQKNLWVISDKMPVFLMSELDYSDVNFRIFFAPISVLIQGTVCENDRHGRFNPINDPLFLQFFNNRNSLFKK